MQQVKIRFISPSLEEYTYWGLKGKNLWVLNLGGHVVAKGPVENAKSG